MRQYLNLLADSMCAQYKKDRTGTGTYSMFGRQMRFDLQEGFPLVTTKKLFIRGIIHELLWFISGNTNIKYLQDNKVHIWDEWADKNGELGPVYGAQWRNWKSNTENSIDQLNIAIDTIKTNPNSRRIIVNAWNVAELENMALPPCHMMYQFNVSGKYLDLLWYQRSVDIFLGLPFNIASYALLLSMVAKITNKIPRNLIFSGGDVHLYSNHVNQAVEQLKRKPKKLPALVLFGNQNSIEDFKFEDILISDYNPWPHIAAPIAV